VAKIVANRALMGPLKAFQFRLVSPHDPAVKGLIELAGSQQSLTDPVGETRAGDVQCVR